jgi:hypothetical protein
MPDEIIGKRFGLLEVREYTRSDLRSNRYYLCECDCGTVKEVRLDHMKRGSIASCRCAQREAVSASLTKHGNARVGHATREYHTWQNMKARCTNPRDAGYRNYGARGIQVCGRWMDSFENFLDDMGHRPEGRSLDRIDVNGDYEPSNCRWATIRQQARNTTRNVRLTHNGKTQCVADWADELGIKRFTLMARLHRGWSIQQALETPLARTWTNRKEEIAE